MWPSRVARAWRPGPALAPGARGDSGETLVRLCRYSAETLQRSREARAFCCVQSMEALVEAAHNNDELRVSRLLAAGAADQHSMKEAARCVGKEGHVFQIRSPPSIREPFRSASNTT